MKLFTLAFWKNALEATVVAGATAFGASLAATSGNLNAHNLEAAGIAAGMGALYALVKQLGAVQASNALSAPRAASPLAGPPA